MKTFLSDETTVTNMKMAMKKEKKVTATSLFIMKKLVHDISKSHKTVTMTQEFLFTPFHSCEDPQIER